MRDNAIEVDPSKCGFMLVSFFNSPSVKPFVYDGNILPTVNKYFYLGIKFNDKLDTCEMTKYKLIKGKARTAELAPTLRNYQVQLEYKCMFI